jgi:hypothetical protein
MTAPSGKPPRYIKWDGSNPKTTTSKSEILLGCSIVAFIFVALMTIGTAVFTVALNVVLFDIFGVIDAPLSLLQGFAVWVLFWIIGGAFKAVT